MLNWIVWKKLFICIKMDLALNDQQWLRGCPRGVMVKAMDSGMVVSEFKLQSRYYSHFQTNNLGKVMNPLILLAMGKIVPLPFF